MDISKVRIVASNDDDDDGDIRWDGDEHCSDRLSCNFEFHSIVGLKPL